MYGSSSAVVNPAIFASKLSLNFTSLGIQKVLAFPTYSYTATIEQFRAQAGSADFEAEGGLMLDDMIRVSSQSSGMTSHQFRNRICNSDLLR